MKTTLTAEKINPRTSPGGVVKIDLARRLVDGTLADLDELIAARLEEFLDGGGNAQPAEVGYLDRAGVAQFLAVSTAQIDKLCRDHGLPYRRVGDVKRFSRDEVRAWVATQERE